MYGFEPRYPLFPKPFWAYSSMAEQAAHNRWVLGSSPSGPTKFPVLLGIFIDHYTHSPYNKFKIDENRLLNGPVCLLGVHLPFPLF